MLSSKALLFYLDALLLANVGDKFDRIAHRLYRQGGVFVHLDSELLLEHGDQLNASRGARWLVGQRNASGGFGSTQDTVVGLHALTDAILGAIGDGDIGEHFPPSDPTWKDANSRLFVEDAAARVRALGGRISNVDVTLICEAPKVGPHRTAMRQAIASSLQIDTSRVGVKATTTEGLGLVGRREGIAAMASATVLLPR